MRQLKPKQQRLFTYLMSGKTINLVSAWDRLGIVRPDQILRPMRTMGFRVKQRKATIKNHLGEECHVTEYYMTPKNIEMNIRWLNEKE
jgi:hypothetical protein